MKTAVVTGASAGMGQAFVRHAVTVFPEIECYWLIGRREGRLCTLADELVGKQTVCMALDLCDEAAFTLMKEKLHDDRPELVLLINNAGCGYLGNVGEMPTELQTHMTNLNVTALTAVTSLCIPYMNRGARIINVSSIAAFCPNPRMTVYSSTKAYVSAFSSGLREELREKGVVVTVVSPGPMDTEFLTVGGIRGRSKMFETLPCCDPSEVAERALRASKAGRAYYTPKAFYKIYRFLAKLLPQAWIIKLAKT